MMQYQSEDRPMYKHPKEDNILDRTDPTAKFVHVCIVCLANGHELGKLLLLLVRLQRLILLLHPPIITLTTSKGKESRPKLALSHREAARNCASGPQEQKS